jgi:tetratricopeptide (TPR) repeat protein
MRRIIWLVAFGVVLALGAVETRADDNQICFCKTDDCIWKDTGIEPGLRACTRMIQSGVYTRKSQSRIYSQRGWWKKQKSDYDNALQDYDEAIRIDPNNAEAYEERGNVWEAKDDKDRAIADWNTAMRIDPDYAPPYVWRGEVLQERDDIAGARADYHAALALRGKDTETKYMQGLARDQLTEIAEAGVPDPARAAPDGGAPNPPGSFLERAAIYGATKFTMAGGLSETDDLTVCSNGDGEVAIAACSRYIADVRASGAKRALLSSLLDRATIYGASRRYDLALRDFDEAISLAPDIETSFNWRGQTRGMKGDYDLAIDDFSRAIRLEPNFASAYFNRAQTYRAKDANDLAIKDFNAAIRLNPDYAVAYRMRGAAYHSLGNYDDAIGDFSKAIELSPDYAAAYNARGFSFLARKDYLKASQDFTTATRLAPGDPEIANPNIIITARACAGEIEAPGKPADACVALIANPFLPTDIRAEAHMRRALADLPAASKRKSYDRTLGDLAEAIRLSPRNAAAAYRLRSFIQSDVGNLDRALADITKAIELDPAMDDYALRSMILAGKGENDRAIADLDVAIRKSPGVAYLYVLRADAARAKSDVTRAAADYQHAIERDPSNKQHTGAIAWSRKGDLQYAAGNVDAAIASYDEAIKLDSSKEAFRAARDAAIKKKNEKR